MPRRKELYPKLPISWSIFSRRKIARGLVAAGEPESVILPLGSLTQELRVQALARLARLTEGPSQKPPLEFLPQALGVFQPEGPGRRVMFILSDGVREIDPQKKILARRKSSRLQPRPKLPE